MTLCYVTDRKAFAGSPQEQIRALIAKMESAASAGVDCIQIREKDLPARELAAIVEAALRRIPRSCRILVNDRLDVAAACGAGGVHLGERSVPVEQAKRFVREKKLGDDFLVGVSVHSLESAQLAEQAAADYIIFGPVYGTPSKVALGQPQGTDRLANVCENVSIPVMAIGGIAPRNLRDCMNAGASGIAAIRMFQDADDVHGLVQALHHHNRI